jgi:lysophospholipase L1-like esterase
MRLVVFQVAAVLLSVGYGAAADAHWVGTWGCAPQLTEPRNLPPEPGLANNTLLQIVHTSIGGKRLRLRFSNEFGNEPVEMKAVSLALSAGSGAVHAETVRTIEFLGASSVEIPAGKAIVSDEFDYDLAPLTDYAVRISFGNMSNALVTGHPGSRSTSYLTSGTGVITTAHWYIFTGIDVLAAQGSAVVILGDSITDGRGSDTDGNNRWTDNLARALQSDPNTHSVSVLNEGLGGNDVIIGGLGPPAVARIERDLLGQSSARWLILMEGVNDIGVAHSDTIANELIAAYRRLADIAHSHHILVYGVPILPFGKSMYDSTAHQAARQAVNDWIRHSGVFDAVIDMDAAVRDPAAPNVLLSLYDSGDHLHPDVAGYRKMAEIVDLKLFK